MARCMVPQIKLIFSYAHLIYFHTHRLSRAVRFVLRTLTWWKPTDVLPKN